MQLYMPGKLGRAGVLVLDECDQPAGGDAAGEQLGGGDAGQVADVAVEVRLVVVAAVERDVGQRRAGFEGAAGAPEAQQARARPWGQGELVPEARRQTAGGVAGL